MVKIFIHAWNINSKGAKALSTAIGGRRIRLEGSTFVGGPDKVVINWGSSEFAIKPGQSRVLNHPDLVKRNSNKISFFSKMRQAEDGPRIPEYTTSLEEALDWEEKGFLVVGRANVTSSGGKGITFLEDDIDAFQKCKLWTQYKKKKDEFRVHIIGSEVILVQRKGLRKTDDNGNEINPETIDFRIRNLANGFVFVRNDVAVPADVLVQAKKAHAASGLDFGAYDIIFNDHEKAAYVLEVNTAPGLEGTTIDDYTNGFRTYLG